MHGFDERILRGVRLARHCADRRHLSIPVHRTHNDEAHDSIKAPLT